MPLAYIALGSNLGDRLGQLQKALDLLVLDFPVEVLAVSPIYQNRAVGMGPDADDFLNATAKLNTLLEPLELLDACLETESRLGRTRSAEGWAPRTIDLDVLHYEGVAMESERLVLPHPRISERDFVAVPLSDIAPEVEVSGQLISSIVADLDVIELQKADSELTIPNS